MYQSNVSGGSALSAKQIHKYSKLECNLRSLFLKSLLI